jgi:hypothetical protein
MAWRQARLKDQTDQADRTGNPNESSKETHEECFGNVGGPQQKPERDGDW